MENKNINIKTILVVILSSFLSFSAFADSNEDSVNVEVTDLYLSEGAFAEDVSVDISNEELDDVFLETLAVN